MICLIGQSACKTPFYPPEGRTSTGYLVVSGYLNAGSDSTIITLSRTRSLTDSVPYYPEFHAQVQVLGQFGEVYFLNESANGTYTNPALNLNANETYQLQILSAEGKKYLSDSIPIRVTPAIDSISWKQDSTSSDNKIGVNIYANTHDPANNTRYYQWEYVETYEHDAAYESFYLLIGSSVVLRNADQFTYQCYNTVPSTSLTIGSSARLSEDVIFEQPLVFIPQASIKLGYRYSILVKQFAITREAYEYWGNLKKNTELTGSIFDPQPSQVSGNMHCTTNPDEPVLGYLSGSTVQQQRIFIKNSELAHWGYALGGDCTLVIGTYDDPIFRSRGYRPVQQYLGGAYTSAYPSCIDCTSNGGTTIRPSFW